MKEVWMRDNNWFEFLSDRYLIELLKFPKDIEGYNLHVNFGIAIIKLGD